MAAKGLIFTQLEQITNRDLRRRKTAARNGYMADLLIGKN